MTDLEYRPGEASTVLDLPEADKQTPFTPVEETHAAQALEGALDVIETSCIPEEIAAALQDIGVNTALCAAHESQQNILLN